MKLTRREAMVISAAGMSLPAAWAGGGAGPRPGEVWQDEELPAREASWYKKLDAKRVECKLCPQGCTVADAERGMCGVRENRGGTYFTLVHSLACSVHVDPIEKKPLFHVLPGEQAFSYAAAGCNVECKFCQNWEISQFRPEQVRSWYLPPDSIVELCRRAGAKATAATYSEPVVFWEYVRDCAAAAQKAGLHPTVVTNGFINEEPLRAVLPLLSAVKVDLKSFRDSFYKELVRGRLEPVLKALEVIRSSGVWLEVVDLLIPTRNDSEEEIRELARWVKSKLGAHTPVHFTRFHPTYRLTNLPPTPVATLERAWKVAREEGLEFVYLGNVPGHPAENTVCPACDEVLIRRVGYQVDSNALVGGSCRKCGREIPGVWE